MGEEEEGMRSDRWGYPVRTGSAECVAVIGSYYDEVLSYGRRRSVILRARSLDPACVLANALAAHFLARADPAGASSFLSAAAASLDKGSAYEKAVFRAVSCLVGEGRDEEAALQRHIEASYCWYWVGFPTYVKNIPECDEHYSYVEKVRKVEGDKKETI